MFAPTQKEVDNCIADIQATGLNITDEGNVKDFLGVNIECRPDGRVKFSQPHLINKILKALRIDAKTTPKDTPAASSRILSRGTNSVPFDQSFHYHSVIGMLNYLDAGSRSDIAYATHQCACFAADPKMEHGKAVSWIGRYLNGTKDKRMLVMPDSPCVSKYMLMLILRGTGIRMKRLMIEIRLDHVTGILSNIWGVPSCGSHNCKQK